MKIMHLLVGVSGAGKSTLVTQIQKEMYVNKMLCHYFSLDNLRFDFYLFKRDLNRMQVPLELYPEYNEVFAFANQNESEFKKFVDEDWKQALTCDNIIVDNTNLTKKSRARWINDARAKGFGIVGYEVNTSLENVLKRQLTRGDKCVPAHVVRDMYMRQERLLQGTECDELQVIFS